MSALSHFKTATNPTIAAALIFVGVTVLGGLVWLCVEFWAMIL